MISNGTSAPDVASGPSQSARRRQRHEKSVAAAHYSGACSKQEVEHLKKRVDYLELTLHLLPSALMHYAFVSPTLVGQPDPEPPPEVLSEDRLAHSQRSPDPPDGTRLSPGIQLPIASDIREICCDLDALQHSLTRQLYGLGSLYGIDHGRPSVETPEVTSAVDLAHIQADDTPSYNAGMEQIAVFSEYFEAKDKVAQLLSYGCEELRELEKSFVNLSICVT